MVDETDITARLAAEDYDAAVEAILGLYGGRIFRMMVGILRDESAAQDTFQTFSIALWQSLPSFNGDSRVYTWTYTIARRTIGKRLSKAKSSVDRLHTDQELALAAKWTRTATAEWRKTESRAKLQELLDELDTDDRTLVMLRIGEAMPWDQVAAVLSDEDGVLDSDALKKEAARLRKRFERVKTRLQHALED